VRTTIALKISMAVSGAVFIAFVLLHMYGNLQAFGGHDAFNEYAEHLRTFGQPMLPYTGLLWAIRIGLVIALVVHVVAAVMLWRRARAARTVPYVMKKRTGATFASGLMRWGGATILLFLVWHLLNFTIGKVNVTDDFEEHLRRMDRAVVVAQRLGAPYIRVFSFFLTGDQRPEDHRDEVVRRMAALAVRAAAGGVVLLHENEKEIFGDVPARVHDLVTAVDSPALRLAWDAANYVQCGVVPFPDAYRLLRPFTDYIQIKDAVLATGEVVPAGDGDGRLRETVRALADDGYEGFVSMEPHLASAHHLGGFSGPDDFARATKAFLAILDSERVSYR